SRFDAGVGRRTGFGPVEQHHALGVARLQALLTLIVAVGHELARRTRVIEADGVPDLVRDGIADVVHVEASVEADLPRLLWVETDERALDGLLAGRTDFQCDVGEGAPDRLSLRADNNVGGARVANLAESDVGHALPHAECCCHLAAELFRRYV